MKKIVFLAILFTINVSLAQTGNIYTTTGDVVVSNIDSLKNWIVNWAEAGDTILVRGGTYFQNDNWQLGNDGSDGNPIVIKGYGDEVVIINQSGAGSRGIGCTGSVLPSTQNHYWRFENITFENAPTHAFWLNGDYNQIKFCTFRNTGATSVQIISGDHFYFMGNEIDNSGYNGLSFESRPHRGLSCDFAIVEFNYIHNNWEHACFNGFPMQGTETQYQGTDEFYLDGHIYRYNICEGKGNYFRYIRGFKVYGNVIIATARAFWLASDGGFSVPLPYEANAQFYNNVFIYNNHDSFTPYGIRSTAGAKLTIKNNIFYNYYDGEVEIQLEHPLTASDEIKNNCFYSSRGSGDEIVDYNGYKTLSELNSLSNCSGNIYADPMFNDFSNNIWTLQSGSPCIETGLSLASEFDDAIYETQFPFVTFELVQRTGNWDMGTYEETNRTDITPPEVTGATLLDSITLKIMFSEVLDETTAEDENNYSIINNIDIFNASLSGSEVTLQTSVHTPGTYTVTVTNVTDPSGNTINLQANAAEYEMSYDPPAELIQLEVVDVTASVVPQPEHHPLKTIDNSGYYQGNPDSRWAGDTMPEWLCFDLGTNKNVSLTKLEFYNWNTGRIYDFSIQLSVNNTNWTTVVSNASSNTEQWTINEFTAMEARYVKIVFHSSNQNSWAGLWESQIWGNNAPNGITSEISPEEFELAQNYPNPFNPSTKIKFTIPNRAIVVLKVFNLIGQEVAELVNADMERGVYEIDFNAFGYPSGVYLYRLMACEVVQTKKMVFLK